MRKALRQLSWLDLICFIAGALYPLAFAPFHHSYVVIISLAVLLFSWLKVSPARAAWLGWLYGLAATLIGVSWIFVSIHTYGNASVLLAGIFTLIVAMVMALYPSVLGYAVNKFFPGDNWAKILLVFPAAWVVFELLRATLFTGVPWLLVGYSQTNTVLAGYAPIGSVYLVSLIAALVSSLLIMLLRGTTAWRLASIVAMAALWGIGVGLHQLNWTHPTGRPEKVSLIQGNVPVMTKWNPAKAQAILTHYMQLTQKHWSSSLIFWPEAAVPLFAQQIPGYLKRLDDEADSHRSSVLFGLPLYNEQTNQYFNGAMVEGHGHGVYHKHHLLPFGEYTPLPWLFDNALSWLHIPMSHFSKGRLPQPLLQMQNLRVALFICYETAFARQVRTQSQGADLLAAISDDSWFGHSIGPLQHEQIAQMRAIETGRYLVRATNSGITSIIGPQGTILERAPSFKVAVLTATVRAMHGQTPWMRYGLWPLLLLLFAMLIAGRFFCRRE